MSWKCSHIGVWLCLSYCGILATSPIVQGDLIKEAGKSVHKTQTTVTNVSARKTSLAEPLFRIWRNSTIWISTVFNPQFVRRISLSEWKRMPNFTNWFGSNDSFELASNILCNPSALDVFVVQTFISVSLITCEYDGLLLCTTSVGNSEACWQKDKVLRRKKPGKNKRFHKHRAPEKFETCQWSVTDK